MRKKTDVWEVFRVPSLGELEALNYLLERTRELREDEDLVESGGEVRVVKNEGET